MPQDNKYEVADLIASALEQKPVDFETAFSSLMQEKLRAAVEAKKLDVAQTMFAGETSQEVEEEESVDEES